MRKKSSYRPRAKLVNPVAFVLNNVSTVNSDVESSTIMRAQNHAALDEISKGRGTFDHLNILVGAMNIADVLGMRGKGKDWAAELQEAQVAIQHLAERAAVIGRYTFTGPELAAVNLAMQVHDAQLDECTVGEIKSAGEYIRRRIKSKQVVILPKMAVTQPVQKDHA